MRPSPLARRSECSPLVRISLIVVAVVGVFLLIVNYQSRSTTNIEHVDQHHTREQKNTEISEEAALLKQAQQQIQQQQQRLIVLQQQAQEQQRLIEELQSKAQVNNGGVGDHEEEHDAVSLFENGEPRVTERYSLRIAIDNEFVGVIELGLFHRLVPRSCNHFRRICLGTDAQWTYNSTVFHRIIPGFVVQGGAMNVPWDSQYPALRFNDEATGLALKHDRKYVVQRANLGADTNMAQWCIMLNAAPHLNGKHVVFGRVIGGFDVVDLMERAGTSGGQPTQRVEIMDCNLVVDSNETV